MLVWMPEYFTQDCLDCDCDIGEFVQYKKGKGTQLEATPEQLAELRSRAEHYCHPYGPDGSGLGALKRSARAVLKRLDKLGM